MSKYNTLVNILDVIRKEAPESYKIYYPIENDIINLNKSRSRSLLHLFLKVRFGLLTFLEREKFITDGIDDGGIDAYYIDKENKKIYFIQSKFRNNESNFESKEIKFEELINMDIDRITSGNKLDENGKEYNSKILNLIKEIEIIPDAGRYKYEIIILANTKDVSQNKLRKLSDGNPVEEYNFERVYKDLVFPVVTGTYYCQSELIIEINLSNKTSEEISYTVETEFTDCQITALFVPTIEIAKALYKYKNTILKYNPRSYLDMKSGTINSEIAKTITTKKTNEFALFNNGITMLSDDTDLNKKIARYGIGQLIVTNPQIINGGQTAYTLSRIYEDTIENKTDINVFENKEVLLKVITFNKDEKQNNEKKLMLIEAISKATNQQTEVTDADRRSNDKIQIELQNLIYENYGLFYQRKSGEFGEGLKNKYIEKKQIIDRELVLRLGLAINGKSSEARRSGGKTLFKKTNFDKVLNSSSLYEILIFSYNLYLELTNKQNSFNDSRNNKDGIINYGYSLRYGKFAVISSIIKNYDFYKDKQIKDIVDATLNKWQEFENFAIQQKNNSNYFREVKDEFGNLNKILNFDGYYKGYTVNSNIQQFNFIK